MIAERGIDGLSLRALARRFGATTGLVTHHFLDRAELVEAALDHATEVILGRIAALEPGAEPFEMLAAVLPTDEVTMEHWRFALSTRVGALHDDSLRRFEETIVRTWETNLPGLLAPIAVGDPLEAARHLVAVVDGIALHTVLDPAGWPPDRQLRQLGLGFDAVTSR